MNKLIIAFLGTFVFALFLSTMLLTSPLDEELQKLKQAGIPTTIDELNLPEILDNENGALVYKEATDLIYVLVKKYKEFQSLPVSGSVVWENVPEEEKKKVADLVLHNPDFSRVYQLLEKASRMKCKFYTKEDYQKLTQENKYIPNSFSYQPIAGLRICARLLVDKARLEADYGTIDNALNACLTGLRLGKAFSNDPLLVSMLNRYALDAMALSTLGKIIDKGEGNTRLYQSLVDKIEAERNAKITNFGLKGNLITHGLPYFSYYRKLGKKVFEFNEDDRKDVEKITQIYKGDKKEIEEYKEYKRKQKEALKEAYLKSRCKDLESFFDAQEIYYLGTISEVISLTNKPFWEAREQVQKVDNEIVKPPKEKAISAILTQWMFLPDYHGIPGAPPVPCTPPTPYYYEFCNKEASLDALLGAAELGLANRIYRQKHGKFADSLNQLTPEILLSLPLDPFTGKNYIYRLKDKGFIVYSVADNLKDDNGIPQFSEKGKQGDFDIVWEDKGAE